MKAKSIKDIYNLFIHEEYLQKEQKDFYVPLYDRQLRRFVTALKQNEIPSKSFFIAGQSGNGKSSVLNLLTTNFPELDEKYEFHYIAGRKVFLYDDIDIIDILLMIANKVVENSESLKQKYFEKLKRFEDIKDGSLQESETTNNNTKENTSFGAKFGVGAKFFSILKASGDFEASYKINEEIRKDARTLFDKKVKNLIDLVNELILEYKTDKNLSKDLVIVIDDLEKKENIDTLFIKDLQLLNQLNSLKIITMPIHLQRNNTFADKDIREFGLKLTTFEGEEFTQDIELLEKIIKARLDDETLISKEAINLAVKSSGGNLRQLIKIVHFAAEEALTFDSPTITQKEMQASLEELQRILSAKVMGMQTFLNQIKEQKIPNDSDETANSLAKAIKMELIFPYFNGTIWYTLNPLVVYSLDRYNQRHTPNTINNQFSLNLDKTPIENNFIDNIKIKNYFSINEIELSNLKDKKEIYFVGENGEGKTILLQALALAFKNKKYYPLLAKEYIKDISETFSFITNYNFIHENLYAYGINRNKIDSDEKDDTGYSGLFDTPSLKSTTFLNRPQDLFLLDNPNVSEFVERLVELLEYKIEIKNIDNQIKFYETKTEIEFKMLSEGYKSTIIWLSDLVFRLIKNQSEIKKLEDFKAVVLIDEIDLYLHPKWKYNFVYKLRKIFPNIQFFMTTHSPTTILGASKDAVFYNVHKDENGITQISEQYDDISDYSANILITSPLFDMDTVKSRAYNDKQNYLNDDDYKEHQLSKKIDKMLENNADDSIKFDILKQLEEHNERI